MNLLTFHLRTALPVLAALAVVFTASPSRAEDDLICAAVYACALDSNGKPTGDLLPQFAKGECAEKYRSQCVSEVTNSLSEELQSCNAEGVKLESSNEALKTKVRKLERQLRRLRARF